VIFREIADLEISMRELTVLRNFIKEQPSILTISR
jgi:predicted transcriptional regulator